MLDVAGVSELGRQAVDVGERCEERDLLLASGCGFGPARVAGFERLAASGPRPRAPDRSERTIA
jgi:hypothetical protein